MVVDPIYVYDLRCKSLSWYREGFYELKDINTNFPYSYISGYECTFKNIYTGELFKSFYKNMTKLDDNYSIQIRRDALLENLI